MATLYWITGLSGAGKTTIGKALYEKLKERSQSVVFLDGDKLREIFGSLHGHSIAERKLLAQCYSNLCRMLTEQGMDVVCATMSLFCEVHDYNRQNIPNYLEIFVECDMQELIRRDQKGIYSKALNGELDDVIGVNAPYDRPASCDLVIDNTEKKNLGKIIRKIINLNSQRSNHDTNSN